MSKTPAVFLGALLLALPLAAAPYLVKDLNRGPADPAGAELGVATAVGGVLYFAASDPAHGEELWRSDGTAAGTYRVTDVCPGRCSSSPREILALGGSLYWDADDGVAGRELWTSDGVPGHERRVKDLCPGPCDGNPQGLTTLDLSGGRRLLFFAQLGRRLQLWTSDGTAAGTSRLALLCTTAADGSGCGPSSPPLSVGDRALFTVFRPDGSTALWETDGTAAGTFPVARLVSGLPGPALVLIDAGASSTSGPRTTSGAATAPPPARSASGRSPTSRRRRWASTASSRTSPGPAACSIPCSRAATSSAPTARRRAPSRCTSSSTASTSTP